MEFGAELSAPQTTYSCADFALNDRISDLSEDKENV